MPSVLGLYRTGSSFNPNSSDCDGKLPGVDYTGDLEAGNIWHGGSGRCREASRPSLLRTRLHGIPGAGIQIPKGTKAFQIHGANQRLR